MRKLTYDQIVWFAAESERMSQQAIPDDELTRRLVMHCRQYGMFISMASMAAHSPRSAAQIERSALETLGFAAELIKQALRRPITVVDVLAGLSCGGAAPPEIRALIEADIVRANRLRRRK